VSSVLRPHQHSIGYTGDGFYRSKDPTNSIKSTEGDATKESTRLKISDLKETAHTFQGYFIMQFN